MRSGLVAALGVLAAVVMCSDACAMCSGGGMSGGQGGSRGIGVSGGGGKRSAAKSKPFTKAELPAEASIAALDTSAFDGAYTELSLSAEQSKKVEDAKKDIRESIAKLLKKQSEARSDYAKANDEKSCMEAGAKVVTAAAACKNFDPKREFDSAVSRLLTHEQRADLKVALAKKNS